MKKLCIMLTVSALSMSSCVKRDSQEALVPADYTSWASTVEGPLSYEIPGHTLAIRKIYINRSGTTVVPVNRDGRILYDYPIGTVILKENYSSEESESPDNLTVMVKNPSHPASRGGWVWVSKDVSSGEERLFSDEFCFTCHQNANERHPYSDKNAAREFRDFVFYPWKSSE